MPAYVHLYIHWWSHCISHSLDFPFTSKSKRFYLFYCSLSLYTKTLRNKNNSPIEITLIVIVYINIFIKLKNVNCSFLHLYCIPWFDYIYFNFTLHWFSYSNNSCKGFLKNSFLIRSFCVFKSGKWFSSNCIYINILLRGFLRIVWLF